MNLKQLIKGVIASFMVFPAYCLDANQALQDKLTATGTMWAHFSQVVKAKNRTISHAEGTMALSRPGHFRWQTDTPNQQLIIADGNKLWVFDKDLDQVTVKKQGKSLGSTAALFLSDSSETVRQDFSVSYRKEADKDYFDLKAKSPKANFQRVILIYQDKQLVAIEFDDQLGQHTQVHFNQIQMNPALKPSLFQFKIPKGVDVVEQ